MVVVRDTGYRTMLQRCTVTSKDYLPNLRKWSSSSASRIVLLPVILHAQWPTQHFTVSELGAPLWQRSAFHVVETDGEGSSWTDFQTQDTIPQAPYIGSSNPWT